MMDSVVGGMEGATAHKVIWIISTHKSPFKLSATDTKMMASDLST